LVITRFFDFSYWSQLEMDLNSVERVEEYLHLPQEPPAIVEGNRPPAYWPSTSSKTLIHVEDLVIKYSPELPAVIHGISFDVKPREKIGALLYPLRLPHAWQLMFPCHSLFLRRIQDSYVFFRSADFSLSLGS